MVEGKNADWKGGAYSCLADQVLGMKQDSRQVLTGKRDVRTKKKKAKKQEERKKTKLRSGRPSIGHDNVPVSDLANSDIQSTIWVI